MNQGFGAPVWPTWEMIAKSLNARSNIYGRMADDPLLGVIITSEMRQRAHDAAFPPRTKEPTP